MTITLKESKKKIYISIVKIYFYFFFFTILEVVLEMLMILRKLSHLFNINMMTKDIIPISVDDDIIFFEKHLG